MYYDSQSGLHLPVHNETEIKLMLDVRNYETSFVAHNLSKDRLEAEELDQKLVALQQKGIHGAILPQTKFPRDVRNLHTLSMICPPNFCVVLNSGESNKESNLVDGSMHKAKKVSKHFSRVLNYGEGLETILQSCIDKKFHTTLSLDVGETKEPPIALANTVASKIDAHGGCDYIWISTNENGTDLMVQIAEELMYLDVAGATVKSRLMVDAVNEDVVEDTLFAGVNKYVISDENQIEMVESLADDQGKALLRM